eukprot:scaffold2193_cov171-Amphora_coffeaeformis.AAC.12
MSPWPQHRTERDKLRLALGIKNASFRAFIFVGLAFVGAYVEGFCLSSSSQLASARGYHARSSYELDNSGLKAFQRRASSIDSHTEKEEGQIFSSSRSRSEGPPPTNDSQAMSKWNDDDLETYQVNLQLAALAESCASYRNVTAAKVALQLLHSMEQPDSVAYNSVLKALAKISPSVLTSSGKTASDAAEILLLEMQGLHKRQVAANEAWYERLSEGTLSDEQLEVGPPRVRVKPNVRSISTVMDALGRTGDVAAARRAEELLYALQREYEATNDGALQPNLISQASEPRRTCAKSPMFGRMHVVTRLVWTPGASRDNQSGRIGYSRK